MIFFSLPLLSADRQHIKVTPPPVGDYKTFTSTSGKSPRTDPEMVSGCFLPKFTFPPLSLFVYVGVTGVTAPHSLMGQTVSRLDLVSLATAMLGFPP